VTARHYRRGRGPEMDVVDLLRDAGFVAYRLAHGAADVVAMRRDHDPTTQLIQVKSTAGGPYERFGPADRRALTEDADLAGAEAVLAWWPRGRELPKWIDSEDWP
jgi:Holliday junction resolvase